MALQKNSAKPAEKEVKKTPAKAATASKAAPAKATPVKKEAPAKAAPVAAAPVEKVEVPKIGRKELASLIRAKVTTAGAAISEKVANVVVVGLEEVIVEALVAGQQVVLPGFGAFSVVHKDAQERPNPQKPGEKIMVAAHNAPKFKAGSKLKERVNGGNETAEGEDE